MNINPLHHKAIALSLLLLTACKGAGGGGSSGGGSSTASASPASLVSEPEAPTALQAVWRNANGEIVSSDRLLADGAVDSWASMSTHRRDFGAAELKDGRVLVVGGRSYSALFGSSIYSDSEIFTPPSQKGERGSWARGPGAGLELVYPQVIALEDGRALVLVSGTSTALLFDPSKDIFDRVEGKGCESQHTGGNARPLRDGSVLVVSSEDGEQVAQLFDPATNCFRDLGKTGFANSYAGIQQLQDGNVLFVGESSRVASVIYDASKGSFREGNSRPSIERRGASMTLLEDGRLLIVGGQGADGSFLKSAEIYDPNEDSFTLLGAELHEERLGGKLVQIKNRVAILGGINATDTIQGPSSVEFLNLDNMEFERSATKTRFGHMNGYVLPLRSGEVLLLGGFNTGFNYVEAFDPQVAGIWSVQVTEGNASSFTLEEGRGTLTVGGAYYATADDTNVVVRVQGPDNSESIIDLRLE